jgi:hypothetical protein
VLGVFVYNGAPIGKKNDGAARSLVSGLCLVLAPALGACGEGGLDETAQVGESSQALASCSEVVFPTPLTQANYTISVFTQDISRSVGTMNVSLTTTSDEGVVTVERYDQPTNTEGFGYFYGSLADNDGDGLVDGANSARQQYTASGWRLSNHNARQGDLVTTSAQLFFPSVVPPPTPMVLGGGLYEFSSFFSTGPINAGTDALPVQTQTFFVLNQFLRYAGPCADLTSPGFQVRNEQTPAPSSRSFRIRPEQLSVGRSYYVNTIASGALYARGCLMGQDHGQVSPPPDDVVVLSFGDPRSRIVRQNVDLGPGATVYGVRATTSEIGLAARWFMDGYYSCATSAQSRVRVVLGVTNHGSHVNENHGRAWARMINETAAWIGARGYAGQISVAGGIDAETLYNPPDITRSWVTGYASEGDYWLYNYGDAGGCSVAGTTCDNGWTHADIAAISWGEPLGRPLPQIYAISRGVSAQPATVARQWQAISEVAAGSFGSPMEFDAVLTESAACSQRGGCRPPPPAPCCIDAFPLEGFLQLRDATDAETITYGTVQRRVTDIQWWTQ